MQEFSAYFTEEELLFIRNQATINESSNRFSNAVLELIHNKEWLRVGMPDYTKNGPMNAYNIALLLEALAYADGSLGWAIYLGEGANIFFGYLVYVVFKKLSVNKKYWYVIIGVKFV